MAKLVFVLFQILIPILLLNMLIAMMGNTYAIVIEKADKEFLKEVCKIKFAVKVFCFQKFTPQRSDRSNKDRSW